MASASEPLRVLGVLAGEDMPAEQLRRWVESADVVLAADGGADRLLEIGVVPLATVGDLDSISERASAAQERLVKVEDQDTTDCDKLLALARSSGYQSVTLIGVEGDLLDHVLGTIQSAARSSLNVRLALRRGLGRFLTGPWELILNADEGARLSVIPLERCEGVTLEGTKWPLHDAVLDPRGLTSLSNIAEGWVQLHIDTGTAFVFMETDGLPQWDGPYPGEP